jgi:cellulose synthase/poly-beta-1,6-N-acetylglucosamine synthase-like glycosyltransferase
MLTLKIIFWASAAAIFYSYFGYGLLAFLLSLFKKQRKHPAIPDAAAMPGLTVVIAAYNEAAFIVRKIENTLALRYPAGKLQIIVVADGSTDDTAGAVPAADNIKVLYQRERRGKAAAINRAMLYLQTPLVLFSDANTELNDDALLQVVKHFADARTGAVAGEKKIGPVQQATAAGVGESLYWQYESLMKRLDARLYSAVGAAGEVFAMRTVLFRPLNEDVLLDDLDISLEVASRGYRIAYEPAAYAIEAPSASLAEEKKRKVRIGAGALQTLVHHSRAVNLFKNPAFAFIFFSRRLLRWIICPLCMVLVFFTNILLAWQSDGPLFISLLAAQLLFYLLALVGWLLSHKKTQWFIFYAPFYFVFMNFCLVEGFIGYLRGTQTVLWEKARRQELYS